MNMFFSLFYSLSALFVGLVAMAEGERPTLLPAVRWSQRKGTLSLEVELQECQCPDISIKPESIEFSAIAIGATGKNHYAFTLNFFKNIDTESVLHTVTGSSIRILLTKEGSGEWWPRLTLQSKKPNFLKLDFDKWNSESDEEEDEMKKMQDRFMESLDDERKKHERTVEILKKGYLIIYNMIQFLAHLYIFLFCTINLYRGGSEMLYHTYDRVGNTAHFTVVLSLMEAVHPLSGMVKGTWIVPLMQAAGRNFALFCLWLASDHIKSEWHVTVLFIAWSSIELVRYPLYVCQIGNISSYALTWLRYTIWIPLYPLGVFTEAVLFIRASQVFTVDGLYELKMPNALNVTFKFTWLIKLYMAVLFYIFVTVLIPHMWRMRKIKLGGRKIYKQP